MFPDIEEVIVCAIIGELASRSVSFVIETCSSKRMDPSSTEEIMLGRLQRLLLRVGAVIEDAEERLITNTAMLQQLNTMRLEMHRGHFTVDTFRCHAHDCEKAPSAHESTRHSLALSLLSPVIKRPRICSGSTQSPGELQEIVASLETIIQDAAEFIQLSGRCPRLARQPYNVYLLMDNCMFGRQMELEYIINFLYQGANDSSTKHLGVLPIIGPGNVGKSTLVEHVCIDERVRGHFSQILFVSGRDMVTLANGTGVLKYENRADPGGGRVRTTLLRLIGTSMRIHGRVCTQLKKRVWHSGVKSL